MMNEEAYFDNWNNEYDERKNKRPSAQTQHTISKEGWTEYDTSMGHCCFCGKLDCKGTCFK